MGIFRRRASKNNLLDDQVQEPVQNQAEQPPPPAAPVGDVLAAPNSVVCTVIEPWKWLLESVLQSGNNLSIVGTSAELPTATLVATEASPPPTPSNRRRKKKNPNSCSLRLEIMDAEGHLLRAAHGTSEAFDGLEDKDELVRTLQRCRCEHLELSPPSRLVNWDVTKEECKNVVGSEMPALLGNEGKDCFAVLKEPMGSRGVGIFFVRNAEEIHEIIDEHKKEAMSKADFLDELIANKGRIPSWVLQAEVRPCLLIRNRRKFHIRSYVVGVEKFNMDDLIDTYLYKRHEVRIASEPMPLDENDRKNKAAHVVNGAKEFEFLHETPELRGLQDPLELFIAQFFSKHIIQDLSRRVAMSANDETNRNASKFVVAGLDVMVTEDKRLYLLEVNVNPIIPPPGTLHEDFQTHLISFMRDLVDLVAGKSVSNFVPSRVLLSKSQP